MDSCAYCGKYDDYTDQFAIRYSENITLAACWHCFKKIKAGDTLKPRIEPVYQKLFPFMAT